MTTSAKNDREHYVHKTLHYTHPHNRHYTCDSHSKTKYESFHRSPLVWYAFNLQKIHSFANIINVPVLRFWQLRRTLADIVNFGIALACVVMTGALMFVCFMFVCDECVVCCICKVKYNYKLSVDYVYACASCKIIQSKHWHYSHYPIYSTDKTHKKGDEILCVANFGCS